MKEDFLHYVWRFKLIDSTNLKTVDGHKIEVLNFGTFTQTEGPDFFNAQIKINNQLWAGTVEMHRKSSDWYVHNHQLDSNYNNVILHVVWEHDVEVFYPDNKKIPVLVLKDFVSDKLLAKYNNFFSSTKFIPCQQQIKDVPEHIWSFYKERLFVERLQKKSNTIEYYLKQNQNNWEQTTFIAICKGFGLNTNAEVFEQLAVKIPFSVFLKVKNNVTELEALFFGMLNLIPTEPFSDYEHNLREQFLYLAHKFKLEPLLISPSFYKHRPDNFPTIRLSQLANLFAQQANLFDAFIQAKTVINFYKIFEIAASPYWDTHYTFNSESKSKPKLITNSFKQLVIINTIVPLLFSYKKSINQLNIDELIQILKFLPPEKNNTINFFNKLQLPIKSAFDSQILLQLKNEYCNNLQCLHCAIGKYIIK